MGLEIYYALHAPASWEAARVRETVEAARRFALTLNLAEVDAVNPNQKLLFRRLEDMHAIVAAVTGAFKDAAEGMEGQTIAPIAERDDFERLEARGREIFRRNRRSKARKQAAP